MLPHATSVGTREVWSPQYRAKMAELGRTGLFDMTRLPDSRRPPQFVGLRNLHIPLSGVDVNSVFDSYVDFDEEIDKPFYDPSFYWRGVRLHPSHQMWYRPLRVVRITIYLSSLKVIGRDKCGMPKHPAVHIPSGLAAWRRSQAVNGKNPTSRFLRFYGDKKPLQVSNLPLPHGTQTKNWDRRTWEIFFRMLRNDVI